jgi:hypothetical protein
MERERRSGGAEEQAPDAGGRGGGIETHPFSIFFYFSFCIFYSLSFVIPVSSIFHFFDPRGPTGFMVEGQPVPCRNNENQ